MGAFKNLCQPIHLSLESIFAKVRFQLYKTYLEVGHTLLHAHAHLPAVRRTQLLQSAIGGTINRTSRGRVGGMNCSVRPNNPIETEQYNWIFHFPPSQVAAGSLQRGSDPDRTLNKKVIHKRGKDIGRSCLGTPPLTSHSETVLQILHIKTKKRLLWCTDKH